MNADDRAFVEQYLTEVRRGLHGLPSADVEDTIEEMRAHILEEIADRGDTAAVVADFGDAAEVASGIVARRLRPEDGPAVPVASLGLRYSSWATDVVVGFGPLVLVPTFLAFPFVAVELFGNSVVAPIWTLLVGVVLEHWVMSPAELAQTGAAGLTVIPVWQWILLGILFGWAAFYWIVLRRTRSASVGMWMTGLRAVRLNDELMVVRERDISQHPAPLGAGRHRWWILALAIPTGCLCMLLALYYVSFGVGSFLQPWENWSRPFEARTDLDRELELVMDFVDALTNQDAATARALVDGVDQTVLDELLAAGPERGFGFQTQTADGRFVICVYLSEQERRDVYLTVEKAESAEGHDYVESYRISDIELSDTVLPVDAVPEQ